MPNANMNFHPASFELWRMAQVLRGQAARAEKVWLIAYHELSDEHRAYLKSYSECAKKLERRANHLDKSVR